MTQKYFELFYIFNLSLCQRVEEVGKMNKSRVGRIVVIFHFHLFLVFCRMNVCCGMTWKRISTFYTWNLNFISQSRKFAFPFPFLPSVIFLDFTDFLLVQEFNKMEDFNFKMIT